MQYDHSIYLTCAYDLALCGDRASWMFGANSAAFLRHLKRELYQRVAALCAAQRDQKISNDLAQKIARLVSQVGKLLLCGNDEARRVNAYRLWIGRRARSVLRQMDGGSPASSNVVSFPTRVSTQLLGALDDSKRLSAEVCEAVAIKLRAKAIFALGAASVEEIDRFNILRTCYS